MPLRTEITTLRFWLLQKVQSMFHHNIRNLLKKSVRLICDTITKSDGEAGEQHRVHRGGVHHGAD